MKVQNLAAIMPMFFLRLTAFAMDLPHYDLDSLSYTSTDAVIAHLSVDPQHKIRATVTETIYGSLHAGDTLDKLSEFLNFFQPMDDGQDVILFLDSRPRRRTFFTARLPALRSRCPHRASI